MSQINQPTKNCDFSIRSVIVEDKPAIAEFINKFFTTGEPLNEALNRGRKGIAREPLNFWIGYLSERLSLMAVASSGEIIGIALNIEVKQKKNVNEAGADSDSNTDVDKIAQLIDYVEAQMNAVSTLKDGKEMDVKVVAVHENWRNKGVGRKLLEQSRDLAQQKGFKQVRSICTSAYTAKMFIRCGFECVYALSYADCKKEGRIKYLPQEPHTHMKGMFLKF